MPSKARYKTKGGDKDFADKITFNPRGSAGGKKPASETEEPGDQDAKRQVGQFGGAGQPPLMKK